MAARHCGHGTSLALYAIRLRRRCHQRRCHQRLKIIKHVGPIITITIITIIIIIIIIISIYNNNSFQASTLMEEEIVAQLLL